jgi:hypothetical protein
VHDLIEIEEYLRKKFSYETERKAYIYACCKFIINKFIEDYINNDLVLRHEVMEEFRLKLKTSMGSNGIQESWVEHHKIKIGYDVLQAYPGSRLAGSGPQRFTDLKEERVYKYAQAFGIWEEVCPDFILCSDVLNS